MTESIWTTYGDIETFVSPYEHRVKPPPKKDCPRCPGTTLYDDGYYCFNCGWRS